VSEIPEEYLPPKDYLSDKVFALPEVRIADEINLGQYFLDRHVLEGRGSNIAILYKDQKITYEELQKKANRCANAFRSLGIEKNDRVMLRSPNRPEFVIAVFACWKIGAIPVLTHHLLKAEDIIFRANDSESKAIVVSSDAFSEVRTALGECKTIKAVIVFGEEIKGHLFFDSINNGQPDDVELAETTRDDWGRIIYSSGTTGKPKGILNSIGDLVTAITIANRYLLNLRTEDVLGGHPAFTFAFGFFPILFMGHSGCSLSIVDYTDTKDMFMTIEDHRITVLRCVPTVYRMMLQSADAAEGKYDLSSLRLCQSAGEWLPASTAMEWKKKYGVEILDSVGSADLHSIVSHRQGTPDDKLDSSGIPLPGIDCRLVDGNFRVVKRGMAGELILRAPWGLQYWRRPDIQKQNVINGWNRTGLVFEEDDDGYFWLKGRNDDMIVSSGYKIPGGEVENVLLTHNAVHEVAVVPKPDPVRGNIVKAYVVLVEGVEPSEKLAQQLKNYVKEKLEPYKYPREIEFAAGELLPRTSTGKIQRFVLKENEIERSKI
jgi:2-aminobenzoate-CoA ligase